MNQDVTIPNSTDQNFRGWTIQAFSETAKISSGVSGATISAVSVDTAKAMVTEANKQVGAGTFITGMLYCMLKETRCEAYNIANERCDITL